MLRKPRSSASAHSLRQALPRPKAPEASTGLADTIPPMPAHPAKPLRHHFRPLPTQSTTQPVRYVPSSTTTPTRTSGPLRRIFSGAAPFLYNTSCTTIPTRPSGQTLYEPESAAVKPPSSPDRLRPNPNPLLRNRRLIPTGSAMPRSIPTSFRQTKPPLRKIRSGGVLSAKRLDYASRAKRL